MIARLAAVLLLALAGLLPSATGPAAAQSGVVILSTTTSTQDSGLLDVLVPMFEKKTGLTVKTISVGTGQALALAARGEADVTLAHAPALEKKYVDEGKMLNRRLVMYNDFVIVGPADDPAKIKGAPKAVDALQRSPRAGSRFVSRGDKSGTHVLEKGLWKQAGITPAAPWYIESGQGMGATLGIAGDRRAYTITDRAHLARLSEAGRASPILVEKDRPLLNIYSVMEVNPANGPRVNAAGGKAFAEFILSPEVQARDQDLRRRQVRPAALRPDRRQEGRGLLDAAAGGSSVGLILRHGVDPRRHREALRLLLAGDREVWGITLPVAPGLGHRHRLALLVVGHSRRHRCSRSRGFPGARLVVSLVNTGMGLPPVVVGLFVTILLWRSGALGVLELLYTPAAIVLAQFVIAAPIVTGLTLAAVQQIPERFRLQLLALGASRLQMTLGAAQGGAPADAGRGDGRLRRRDLRGRRLDDGGRQHQGLHPRAHHRHRARDRQGQLRRRHRALGDPAR